MMDFEAFMAFDNREYFGNMPRSVLDRGQGFGRRTCH